MEHKVAKEKSVLEVVEKRNREWLVKDVEKEVKMRKEAQRQFRTVKYLSEHCHWWLVWGGGITHEDG